MAQSAHNRYALGVDIGGSHVCSAVVDLATGQLCGEPHTDKVDAAAGARTIAGAWAANIRRTAAASGIGCIRCAGFAFPGPFDYERGISTSRRRSTRCCGSAARRSSATSTTRRPSRWANASAGSRTTPNA